MREETKTTIIWMKFMSSSILHIRDYSCIAEKQHVCEQERNASEEMKMSEIFFVLYHSYRPYQVAAYAWHWLWKSRDGSEKHRKTAECTLRFHVEHKKKKHAFNIKHKIKLMFSLQLRSRSMFCRIHERMLYIDLVLISHASKPITRLISHRHHRPSSRLRMSVRSLNCLALLWLLPEMAHRRSVRDVVCKRLEKTV